jgi:hypothetical protein
MLNGTASPSEKYDHPRNCANYPYAHQQAVTPATPETAPAPYNVHAAPTGISKPGTANSPVNPTNAAAWHKPCLVIG